MTKEERQFRDEQKQFKEVRLAWNRLLDETSEKLKVKANNTSKVVRG